MKHLVIKKQKPKHSNIKNAYATINTLMAFSLLFWPILGHSQQMEFGPCTYSVTYDLTTTTEYAVPNELSMDEISPFDLAKARPFVQHSHVQTCIDDQNQLTEETIYDEPALNPEHWMDQTYRVVVGVSGVSLYGIEGNLQHYFPNDVNDNDITLDPDEVDGFGYELPILPLSDEAQLSYEEEGFDVLRLSDDVYAINTENIETIYNIDKQSIEENIYEDGLLTHTEITQYRQLENGLNIPLYIIEHIYEPMLNGGYMRITHYKVYSNYTIQGENFDNPDNNALVSDSKQLRDDLNEMIAQGKGADLLSMPFSSDEMSPQFEFTLSPNPASESIRVKLPKLSISNEVDVLIMNTSGQVVYSRNDMSIGEYHEINISSLRGGLYIVRASKNGNQRQIKFVKH